mmetsp:Transcript_2386/g.4185  ORF Transcript_2386/g.4185 Transcript_2386/m.4185 type:complete len:226 (-) Transcript_2386:1441-2118(-)|eukprot:CAMPEP_0182444754 /NCGR_PEP_ID=MMETSP1172-20130603/3107_1 /TAXON_ID=708627 /ORGANISM="Timspurckia oligopyrenoides, Strain CCMP3278" /LENGTH=225 /DNA_ID=CAMNT_0024640383 /DNA_START=86 /DNA_END=763 /DNA_ORIENTATION=+
MGSTDSIRFLGIGRKVDRVGIAWNSNLNSISEISEEILESKFHRLLTSPKLAEHDRLTITDREVGSIHFDSDEMCIFVTICSAKYPQRVAFKLLEELQDQFVEAFGPEVSSAREGELNKPMKRMFKDLAMKFNELQNVDEIENVRVQVEEVKGVMENNIQQALQNQENLDTLLDKTDVMRNEASNFQRSSVAVKNKFWWKNTTYLILIAVALVILVLVIVIPLTT